LVAGGAGTRESDYVQQLMMKVCLLLTNVTHPRVLAVVTHKSLCRCCVAQDFAAHYTVHIGDVYYMGTEDEVSERELQQSNFAVVLSFSCHRFCLQFKSNVFGIVPQGHTKGAAVS
jgi:hypothetical protein